MEIEHDSSDCEIYSYRPDAESDPFTGTTDKSI